MYDRKGETVAVPDDKILAPDKMYNTIIDVLNESDVFCSVHNRPLDSKNLKNYLDMGEKMIVFLHCHGDTTVEVHPVTKRQKI